MTTRAFTQGYHARYADQDTCPYSEGTQEAKDWHVGYEEACIDIRNGR